VATISSPSKAISPESRRTCSSSTAAWSALFPSTQTIAKAQSSEINRGRTEERCLTTFAVSPSQVQFPFAAQAAQLTRRIQLPGKPPKEAEIEFLLTSRPPEQIDAGQLLHADRHYWGIENGLHQRLDVVAGEDRSRVRHRNAALNLAVIRRAVVSLAVHWIARCKNPRQATMSGFYDFMSAENNKKAFKLVTTSKSPWLPES
jgi:hypothetical protein